MEKYAVYTHSFNGVVFYVGSGRVYEEEGYISRPYKFSNRSENWLAFCNNNTDQIKVEILFETTDKQLARDKEEEITRYYMELEMPLVNIYIGNKRSEEWIKEHLSGDKNNMYGMKHTKETRNKMSKAHKGKILSAEQKRKIGEANKGEKNHWYGKKGKDHPAYGKTPGNAKEVLMTNHLTNESKEFDSITGAYEFISQNGFDKTKMTLHNYLKNGKFTFKNYTIELDKSKEEK